MGGSGSGNWYRGSKKDTTGDYKNLIMKRLVKEGVIQANQYKSGSWQWLSDGEVTSSIGYIVDTNNSFPYIRLKYTNTKSQQKFDYKITLTTTTPNYGGKRWWFICPASGCNRRVGVLYGGKIYACRHCYKLAYNSQNEATHYRFIHKAQAIHHKLGGSGCTDYWLEKPKGMHQKTFDRLIAEMRFYDDKANIIASAKFGIFL